METASAIARIDEIASRCLAALDANIIEDPYGWPQYLPRRAGDIPGLCGTSYALLAYEQIGFLRGERLVERLDVDGLVSTLLSKMDSHGGFMVDAHKPIPTIDGCWESIVDLLAIGVPAQSDVMSLPIAYLLGQQQPDGGWKIAETLSESLVFPTSQMVSILSIIAGLLPDDDSRRLRVVGARDRGVEWLLRARNADGGWSDGTTGSTAAITTRVVEALLDAEYSEIDLRGDLLGILARFVEDGNTADEYYEALLFGSPFDVPAESPKIFRYSHSTESLIICVMLRLGVSPGSHAIESMIAGILDSEADGLWQDMFTRFDTADGRVAWVSRDGTNEVVANPRVAVWPIYDNMRALVAYVEAVRTQPIV